MNLTPVFQKIGKPWKDETGVAVPSNRVSKLEVTKERLAEKITRAAVKVNDQLNALHSLLTDCVRQINEAIDEDAKKNDRALKPSKGNYTWYNFDRTVKIEVDVHETIQFDNAKIAAARDKFDRFIEKNVQGTDDIIRQLINSAFVNTRGGLDSKKVLSLLKYRTRIKDKLFQDALNLIEESISRPSSKRYFRVWIKDEAGQYKNVNLNFNSIS